MNPVWNWPFAGSLFKFPSQYLQLTMNNNCWCLGSNLWGRKQPLYQLSHNHCPNESIFFRSVHSRDTFLFWCWGSTIPGKRAQRNRSWASPSSTSHQPSASLRWRPNTKDSRWRSSISEEVKASEGFGEWCWQFNTDRQCINIHVVKNGPFPASFSLFSSFLQTVNSK